MVAANNETNNRHRKVPLPENWNKHVKSAILHVISLTQYAVAYTRSWAADSSNARVRLTAEKARLEQEVALLREEIRIKDARLARVAAHRRPHYPPTERMAILQLRAARNWSLEQTAKAFLVTAETVASWMTRVDEAGDRALVQIAEPVNKFPDFVRGDGPAAEDPLPDDGQEEDRRNPLPCGPAFGRDHGRTHAQGDSRSRRPPKPPTALQPKTIRSRQPRRRQTSEARETRRHGQVPQPRLARGPDDGARSWAASGLRGCRSPCPSAGRSAGGWPWLSTTSRDAAWAWPSSRQLRRAKPFVRSSAAQFTRAGRAPKYLICDKGRSSGALASNAGANDARSSRRVRCRRPTRQHRRRRAVHPHAEDAWHARHPGPAPPREDAGGTRSISKTGTTTSVRTRR